MVNPWAYHIELVGWENIFLFHPPNPAAVSPFQGSGELFEIISRQQKRGRNKGNARCWHRLDLAPWAGLGETGCDFRLLNWCSRLTLFISSLCWWYSQEWILAFLLIAGGSTPKMCRLFVGSTMFHCWPSGNNRQGSILNPVSCTCIDSCLRK